MSASLKIDTAPAMKAFRAYALETNRELSAELNRRMFYIGLRAFVLMPPRYIQEAKARAKAYVEAFRGNSASNVASAMQGLGTATGKGKRLIQRRVNKVAKQSLRLVHLIAQSRRLKKGLPALTPRQIKVMAASTKNAFTKGVGSIRSGAAAQGRVKAAIAKMLDSLSKANIGRAFAQYGRAATVNRKGVTVRPETPPNAALAKIASEYGVGFDAKSTTGVFGGLRANVAAAKPGINPVVSIRLEGKIQSDQVPKVNAKLAAAFQQAFNDEAAQLEAKMTAKAQAVADKYSAR
jgi:hypothetical protein